ncbi:hypothetical protein SAMN05660691_00126 [Rheinheimera pacifica]|uniref:Uncharacterized protein n=1 Tax=Rheinheimera pacifica TaxID=173990 RepID=A0A1H6J1X4_9GAMM|nr:hypothetical protein SAMN05660691_00126 [Rheinheimera pacifica]
MHGYDACPYRSRKQKHIPVVMYKQKKARQAGQQQRGSTTLAVQHQINLILQPFLLAAYGLRVQLFARNHISQ